MNASLRGETKPRFSRWLDAHQQLPHQQVSSPVSTTVPEGRRVSVASSSADAGNELDGCVTVALESLPRLPRPPLSVSQQPLSRATTSTGPRPLWSSQTAARPQTTRAMAEADPVQALRECIKVFIARPNTFGSVPQLLMSTYTTVLGKTTSDGRNHDANFFELLSGEAGLLGDLRELHADNERLRKALSQLQQQVDMLRVQLRERELEIAKAERAQVVAEQAEAEQRGKLHAAQQQFATCHSDLLQTKAQLLRLMQQVQQNQSADEGRVAERTADLRAELARLYESARAGEELLKSCDRETTILRTDVEELESKNAALIRELDGAQETIAHKDDEIVLLSELVLQRERTIAEHTAVIAAMRLDAGQAMVLDNMLRQDPRWRLVREEVLGRRVLESSPQQAVGPNGKPVTKGLGLGSEVPPMLRYQGKLRPKALSHADVTQLFVSCVDELFGSHQSSAFEAPYAFQPVEEPQHQSFAEQFRWWLVKRSGEKIQAGAELAYSVNEVIQQRADSDVDPELLLYRRIVDGRVPPSVLSFLLHRVQVLFDKLVEEDNAAASASEDARNALPVTVVHRVLDAFVACPAHHAGGDDVQLLRFLLALDSNTPYIQYRKLFECDENGALPHVLRGLFDLLASRLLSYYEEIDEAVDRITTASAGTDLPTVSLSAFCAALLQIDPGRVADIHLIQEALLAMTPLRAKDQLGDRTMIPAHELRRFLSSHLLVRMTQKPPASPTIAELVAATAAMSNDGREQSDLRQKSTAIRDFFSLDSFARSRTASGEARQLGLSGSVRFSKSFRFQREQSAVRVLLSSLLRRNSSGLPFAFAQRQRAVSFSGPSVASIKN